MIIYYHISIMKVEGNRKIFFIFTKAIPLTDEFILFGQMMFETEGKRASPV